MKSAERYKSTFHIYENAHKKLIKMAQEGGVSRSAIVNELILQFEGDLEIDPKRRKNYNSFYNQYR